MTPFKLQIWFGESSYMLLEVFSSSLYDAVRDVQSTFPGCVVSEAD